MNICFRNDIQDKDARAFYFKDKYTVPANYFCKFSEQMERDVDYKMGIQRYYIRRSDEVIDIMIR